MGNSHSDIESVRILIELLVQKDIRDVVLSPGSRNAPLSVSVARENRLRHFVIPDERSAAFFALGIAQQTGRPVALVCTSGTALLNYAPATAEAYYQGIPLIILSADRPEEWIDQDDSQTIRQKDALRNFVKYSGQLPTQIATEEDRWFANRVINETIHRSMDGKQGPVHLNIPFREPLYGFNTPERERQRLIGQALTDKVLAPKERSRLKEEFSRCGKVMIVAGFHAPDEEIRRQTESLTRLPQVVMLTESVANLNIEGTLSTIDRVLATIPTEEEAAFAPDLLVTFGGAVISRMLKAFIRRHRPRCHWHIDLRPVCPDTYQSLTLHVPMEASTFFRQLGPLALCENRDSDYARKWKAQQQSARQHHEQFIRSLPWCDLKAFSLILPSIPRQIHLQLGNSTPVRYAQLFEAQQAARTDGNRGTSGIDGCTSTAIGASVGSGRITLLITGDIGFLYDSNALWIKYTSPLVKIIVMQNGGGGIFRFLPGSSPLNEVEELFETPYRADIEQLARLHGFQTFTADNENELKARLEPFYQEHEKPALLIVRTSGEKNGELLKAYFNFLKKGHE